MQEHLATEVRLEDDTLLVSDATLSLHTSFLCCYSDLIMHAVL